MSKMIVIVNPNANRGDSQHQIDAGLKALSRSELDFEIQLTERRAHATELAETAARAGAEVIVAAGGDGTVHEVANGILMAAEGAEGVASTTLGVLPIGSGNDFAWGMGMDKGLEDALSRLRRGHTRTIDVGYIETNSDPSQYFINIVGAGFDADVIVEAQKIKRLRGFAIYLVAVLRTLFVHYRTPHVTVRYGDEVMKFPMFMTVIANGPRFGGGFLAAPHASYDDGIFDLCVVHDIGRFEALPVIPKIMKGEHMDHPKVTMARDKCVTIESPDGFASEADGEMVGYKIHQMTITIISQRLRVIA